VITSKLKKQFLKQKRKIPKKDISNNAVYLKIDFQKKRVYRKRGAFNRINKGFTFVLLKYGHEEWKKLKN
jgi:hypothetical protein